MKLLKIIIIVLIFLVAAFGILRFCQSRPTGPYSPREFRSLTNTVRKITTDPIFRVDRVDEDSHVMVYTGSVTNEQEFMFERTRFGWKNVQLHKVSQ